MKTPSHYEVLTALREKGYKVFEDPAGHDLNLVGIRSSAKIANAFDDLIALFYRRDNAWCYLAFAATTDPGRYWLENPMATLGTAILPPGQYRGAFRIGEHQGRYEALVQARTLPVWRDANRDHTADPGGGLDVGWHGINLHHAAERGESVQVDKWSAGCQVIASWWDFQVLMAEARAGRQRFGDSFTYTLIEEADL